MPRDPLYPNSASWQGGWADWGIPVTRAEEHDMLVWIEVDRGGRYSKEIPSGIAEEFHRVSERFWGVASTDRPRRL